MAPLAWPSRERGNLQNVRQHLGRCLIGVDLMNQFVAVEI